ncbi:MAG: DUF1289 domain-containing protein [Hyphomonadaceae bacterium]|nr:DUF1289 domain-containing protein [Hyphomonadaceae bacterium]OUX94062.1 MAG: DUF1289 domain-containing protein [Hyphomonas sp. TMED17]CAI8415003.1 MAG: Uncharacterised protein [Hyphomonas sp. TMED17]
MGTANIESPCIKVCAVSGSTGLCLGCGRTLPEIGRWAAMSADERQSIMRELPERLAMAAPAANNTTSQ